VKPVWRIGGRANPVGVDGTGVGVKAEPTGRLGRTVVLGRDTVVVGVVRGAAVVVVVARGAVVVEVVVERPSWWSAPGRHMSGR